MNPSTHHLGRAKIGQLLAAVGSRHATDEKPPQAASYDWRDPHCFNASQRSRLVQVWGQVAACMAEIFTRARHSPCEVSLKAFTQHYAGDLCRHLELNQNYCLTFGPEKGLSCGFVSIAPQTALAWVTWLLGDADAARDPNRALSSLEESLLSDLVTAVLEVFLAPWRALQNPGSPNAKERVGEGLGVPNAEFRVGGPLPPAKQSRWEPESLRPAGPCAKGQPNLQFERSEEVARIVFVVKGAEPGEPAEIAFVLPCSHLAALAGKTAAAAPPTVSPQELSRALMEHLQEVPVTLRATLASTSLTFQEVLDLGPGDILLLDQPVDGLAELILDGRAAFRGRPARAQGRYAVVVVESAARSAAARQGTEASRRKRPQEHPNESAKG
jgi:flagellar motor switch protein FliM